MNITVFGANGNIGTRVTKRLLAEGHTVTAFIHGNNPFEAADNLSIVNGSIYEPEQVEIAIKGADIVISALGSWGTPKKDILSTAMRSIIPAMLSQNIKRIITLTGADANASYDKKTLFHTLTRLPLLVIGKKIMADSESHIKQLESSNLDWTIIRSPIMSNNGKRGFALTAKRPFMWQTIHRDAVADAIIQQIDSQQFIKQAPFLKRKG